VFRCTVIDRSKFCSRHPPSSTSALIYERPPYVHPRWPSYTQRKSTQHELHAPYRVLLTLGWVQAEAIVAAFNVEPLTNWQARRRRGLRSSASTPHHPMALPYLLRLPVELHLGVIEKLELPDQVNLASTNHYFRFIVKPPTHNDYLLAEKSDWATKRYLFACKHCTRIRAYTEFADEMRKGRHARGGVAAQNRLCLECGIVTDLYAAGATVAVYGRIIVCCRGCKRFPQHASRETPCNKCSSALTRAPASAARRQHDREHRTSRSSRVFIDSNPDDEFYGVWRDA
jgi:hypothetical protein